MSAAEWSVRVPASSANLGAGFDVLGLALSVHAEIGVGPPPDDDARVADDHHPATVAFRRLGGLGELWIRSAIPVGRGMGFSGAVRVGGASAAVVQRDGRDALEGSGRDEVMRVAAELEGHGDNAAASLYGGVVVAVGDVVSRVPLAFDPAVLVWIPDSETTSTDHSRTTLDELVSRSDAVFNLGRVAMFVAACASGDVSSLRMATEDRLHQAARLATVPSTATALEAALEAGVWAAWLSGSGPAVAMLCESSRADEVAAALPEAGHSKTLHIDHEGATVVETVAFD